MAYFSTGRCAVIMGGIVALFVGLVGRVAYLQTYGRESTITRADRQQHQSLVMTARRGDVYDRNGLVMAGTIQVKSLFVDPKFMQDSFQENGRSLVDMDQALQQLGQIIDKDPYQLAQLLGDRATSRFVKVADNLDDATIAKVEAMDLPGVGVTASSARCYPMGSLAAHSGRMRRGRGGVGWFGAEIRQAPCGARWI